MDFLNTSNVDVKYLPTGTDPTLASKIDKRIVINNENKGYICSSETIPIFIGYMNFGLPSNIFTEYCKFLGVEEAKFMYNNEIVNINLKVINVNSDNDEHIQPYIDPSLNPSLIILPLNSTSEITIYGQYFDSYMSIGMGESIIVNDVKNISPSCITINYTTSDKIEENTLIIKRGSISSYGKEIIIRTTDKITGTGVAGNFITDFSNGGNGNSLWGDDWALEVFGNIPNVDNFFKSSKNGTPSSSTGPNSASQFTNSVYYAFTERSSSNYGTGQYGTATTTNFSELTNVAFEWHFAGSSTLDFSVRAFNAKSNSWDILWSYNGIGIHTQSDDAELVSLSVSSDYTKVQFYLGETNSYSADLALGNIAITSI